MNLLSNIFTESNKVIFKGLIIPFASRYVYTVVTAVIEAHMEIPDLTLN